MDEEEAKKLLEESEENWHPVEALKCPNCDGSAWEVIRSTKDYRRGLVCLGCKKAFEDDPEDENLYELGMRTEN